jgi:hypothetical protein
MSTGGPERISVDDIPEKMADQLVDVLDSGDYVT